MGGDRVQMYFFFQICNEVPGVKKGGACRPPNERQAGPVALPLGDRWAQPTGAAGGPVARGGGQQAPLPRATGGPVAPLGDRGKPLYMLQPSPSLLI